MVNKVTFSGFRGRSPNRLLEVSYEIAFLSAEKHKPFSDGEEITKPCLQKCLQRVGDKSIERKVTKVTLSKETITRRIEELAHDVSEQVEDRVHAFSTGCP